MTLAAAGVLITRPHAEAVETAALVTALGFTPIIAPVLAIRACPATFPDPSRVCAILLTSGNALAMLPPSWHGLMLLAVGDATAERARQAGFTDVHSADGDRTALTRLAIHRLGAGCPVLLPCGRGQGAALTAELRASGLRVHRRVVYATFPVPHFPQAAGQAIGTGGVRAALFYSTATATAFARLLPGALRPMLGDVDAIAIGKAAADTLSLLPWRRVRVSLRPKQSDMLALI